MIGIVAAWYDTLRFSKLILIALFVVISLVARLVKSLKRPADSAPSQSPFQQQPFQQQPVMTQPPPPPPLSPFVVPGGNGRFAPPLTPQPERPRSTPLPPLLGGRAAPPPPHG